jgi:hypothetical protein
MWSPEFKPQYGHKKRKKKKKKDHRSVYVRYISFRKLSEQEKNLWDLKLVEEF